MGGPGIEEEPRQEPGNDGGGPLVLEVSPEPHKGGEGEQGDDGPDVQLEGPDS